MEDDAGKKGKASLKWDEIPQDQVKHGSQILGGSRHHSALSEARSTSMLDQEGKRLSEHDQWLKLDGLMAQREERSLKATGIDVAGAMSLLQASAGERTPPQPNERMRRKERAQ